MTLTEPTRSSREAPFRVRIGQFKLKDRRYHTRRYPEFDAMTSQLRAEVLSASLTRRQG